MVFSSQAGLRIADTGSAFPASPFRATVHSVFSSAVNLNVDASLPLLTLMSSDRHMHPTSAVVVGWDGSRPDFTRIGVRPGMSVWMDATTLRLGDGTVIPCDRSRPRERSRETAPETLVWNETHVNRCGVVLSLRQALAGTLLRWNTLEFAADLSPVDSDFADRFRSAAHATRRALLDADAERAVEASTELVGLGPGLTPSGDDFLCGLGLAAWMRTSLPTGVPGHLDREVVRRWLDELERTASGPPRRTSDQSLSFLRLAAWGLFSEAMIGVAATFTAEGPAAEGPAADGADTTPTGIFADRLEVLADFGHSSGLDAATGILFGLKNNADINGGHYE